MTGVEFLIVVLAGIVYGWLWCDPSSHFLDPLKWLVDRALTRPLPAEGPAQSGDGPAAAVSHAANYSFWWMCRTLGIDREPRTGHVATWLRRGRNCPPCMGFQANLTAAFVLAGVSWSSTVAAVAAVAGHVAWMKVLGIADDLVEALSKEA